MSFYIETVKRKSGTRYRIVRDTTRDGRRKRTYHSLPAGTTKDTAKKICCEMNLNAEFGDFSAGFLFGFGPVFPYYAPFGMVRFIL